MNRIELIAQAAHDMNKAYCVFLGDRTQVPWEDTPEDIKESTREGVRFHLDNPDATTEQSHIQWMTYKEGEGWVWGKTKDLVAKTHPCLKEYRKLPKDQRVKDVLFKQMVLSIASMEFPVKPSVPVKPVIPKVPEVQQNKPTPQKKKGFVPRKDVVINAPTQNTKGSGGALRGKPKATEATPVPRESTDVTGNTKSGGLIKSGAGDGAAALAMFE
jgi:hypothetical protein